MNGATATPDSARAAIPDPLPIVRATVRSLLLSSPSYLALEQPRRDKLAKAMVRVCTTAASLIQEEMESDREAQREMAAQRPAPRRPLARAQSAPAFGEAASRVAGTTQAILNAVSFPRFVTELINGVFKAMLDSSMQQMNSYVELLNNVSASLEGFADSNMGADRAREFFGVGEPA